MPKLEITVDTIRSPKHREVCLVKAEGIISSRNIFMFRDLMAKPLESGRDIVIDMNSVSYMNSSALGELVRVNDELQQINLCMIIININPEVGRLLAMLGLDNVLDILPTEADALAKIDGDNFNKTSFAAEASPSLSPSPASKVSQITGAAHVILGMNPTDRFAKFMKRVLSKQDAQVSIIQTMEEAQALSDDGKIDVAIIESTIPNAQSISTSLKLSEQNGLMSSIFVYPRDEERTRIPTFRVCEDEFVVEPFDVQELVILAQSEIERCRAESAVLSQEIHFEIATRDQAIASASDALEKMIMDSGLSAEKADAFFYGLREAIDNARRHGNKSDTTKLIDILYIQDENKISLTIGDEGEGFDFKACIQKAEGSSPLEQARTRRKQGGFGGMGIGLMLRCCDNLEYFGPGNIVKLTISLPK